MFDELLKTVSSQVSTVRAMISLNHQLRGIVFGDALTRQTFEENVQLKALIEVGVSDREWRLYDHCSVVMRLYAIYESFVKKLITDWLQRLPDLVSSYDDLGEKFHNTHQDNIGRLLRDLNKDRFQHLTNRQVVEGLYLAVTGAKYELLPDAFLFHDQNLRKDTLQKLLADAGIVEDAWKWIVEYREIKIFVEEIRQNENSAEGELKQLVDYRNQAAHGFVDQVLGTDELLYLCDFVEALCKALAELVVYQIILKKTSLGQARNVGQITEWYKKSNAAVAKVRKITLTVGSSLFLINENCSYCSYAKIESIMINDAPKINVEISDEIEVGLKFDVDVRKGLALYLVE